VSSIRQFDGDYGAFRSTLALMGMTLLGGTRLRYLSVLERDPLFLQSARLHRLPTRHTLSRDREEKAADSRTHDGAAANSPRARRAE
jgi:hypothetical protein